MTTEERAGQSSSAVAERIGRRAATQGTAIAVAESLTGGLVVQALARAEGSSDWLCGGVVAYGREVKRNLLDVTADKVVSEQAAREMAIAVRRLLGADVAVAVTGAGGPEPQDGEPPGTVWIAADSDARQTAEVHHFAGDPSEVCESARLTALLALEEIVADAG
jgi:nicotinamide-nucleotide amidase